MSILPRTAWTSATNGRAGRALKAADTIALTVHYPALGNGTYGNLAQAAVAELLRGWRALHIKSPRNWADIGYNYAIDGQGRTWNLTGNNRGAHAGTLKANATTVGIVLILGNNEQPTPAMLAAFRALRTHLLKSLPKATKVVGHQHWINTECPGKPLAALIESGGLIADPDPKPDPSPSPPAETVFWIASWNVHGANHALSGPHRWQARGPKVAATASRLGVSILAAQEINTSEMARDIDAAFPPAWLHCPSTANNDVFYDGSKWLETRPAAEYPLTSYQNRKAHVLHFKRKATGGEFTHVNTHFPSGSDSERRKAAAQLSRLLADIDGPVVLTLDGNTAYTSAGSPRDTLHKAGVTFMRDQVAAVLNSDINSHNKFKPPVPGSSWLDDIGTRGPTVTAGQLKLIETGISDHYPLLARIQL